MSIWPFASASTIAMRSSSERSAAIELEEGPVLADVVFVEAQVIDRDPQVTLAPRLRAT